VSRPLLEGVPPGPLPENGPELLAAVVVGQFLVGRVDRILLAAGLRAAERRRVRNVDVERHTRREVVSGDVSSPRSPDVGMIGLRDNCQ
jgi:hypothetical protein